MKNLLFFIFLGILTFAACKKENFETFTPHTGGFDSKTITASFSGIIVDENEKGLADVTVTQGNQSTTTDKNGIFFFNKISATNTKAYFKANKTGYFHGSRTIFAQADQNHQVRIKMLPNNSIATINNSSGGEVILPQGGKLKFDAGDVALPNGNPYSGTVHVAAHRIDPTQANGRFEMPGDLRGITNENKNVVLQSFGMMAVELTDPSGNLLQVAPNQTVEMSFDVPTSLVSSAPSSIPLWYFDESTGDWKEEGSATLTGNTYKGEVSHFSFWNYDAQFETVFFEANFIDEAGNPLVNQIITITLDGWTSYGVTNDDGWVGGLVKANATMLLGMINTCNQDKLLQEFTTTSADINLGVITAIIDNMITYNVTGTVINCESLPITNGYLSIQTPNWYSHYVVGINESNNFSFVYTSCDESNSIVATGYDYDNFVQSEAMTFSLSSNSNIGEIQACDIVIDEFFTLFYPSALTGNDTTTTMIPPNLWLGGQLDSYIQIGGDNMQLEAITFIADIEGLTDVVPTTYSSTTVSIQHTALNIDTIYYAQCFIEITKFPENIGEFLEGNVTSKGSAPIVTGSFRIKRTQ